MGRGGLGRWVLSVLGVALVAVAGGAVRAPAHAGAAGVRSTAEVNVQVGLPRELPAAVSPQSYATMFFPRAVTIHVGDTVTWHFRNRYGLDTVTFPGRPPRRFYIGNDAGQPKVAPVNDAAGYPFWWVGSGRRQIVPPLSFRQQGGSTMSSPAQVRSSGMVRSVSASLTGVQAASYSLTFLKPGVYTYFNIWGDFRAKNRVTVVPVGRDVPSPADEERAGEAQLRRVFVALEAMVKGRPQQPRTVWLGNVRSEFEIAAFIPRRLVIQRGQTVTFSPHSGGSHTVTIGPPAYTEELRRTLVSLDGVTNPVAQRSSEPYDTRQPIAFDGRNHGNGFLSSGCCLPIPGVFPIYRVRFTRAGTYHYVDVFHRGMDGEIVVR
jgi:plastocyanin